MSFQTPKKVGNNWRGKNISLPSGKRPGWRTVMSRLQGRESWRTGQRSSRISKRFIYLIITSRPVLHMFLSIFTHTDFYQTTYLHTTTLLVCVTTSLGLDLTWNTPLLLSSSDGRKTHLWSITYSTSPPRRQKKHLDINSTVNLSEPVLVDYSWRGHGIEQSKLIEADTCQSEALLGPDLIQDILLLLREITGPRASLLREAAWSNPSKAHLLYTLVLTWCCHEVLAYRIALLPSMMVPKWRWGVKIFDAKQVTFCPLMQNMEKKPPF